MKQLFVMIAVLFPFLLNAQVYSDNKTWTNNVLIAGRMHLSITDDIQAPMQDMFKDHVLAADKQPYLTFSSTSTNYESVIWLGMSNSFAFKMLDTNGVELKKTTKGVAMNRGPISQSNFFANNPKSFGPGTIDFPKLTELFVFPYTGRYIFSLQYWTYIRPKGPFVLSSPIQVEVIYEKADNK